MSHLYSGWYAPFSVLFQLPEVKPRLSLNYIEKFNKVYDDVTLSRRTYHTFVKGGVSTHLCWHFDCYFFVIAFCVRAPFFWFYWEGFLLFFAVNDLWFFYALCCAKNVCHETRYVPPVSTTGLLVLTLARYGGQLLEVPSQSNVRHHDSVHLHLTTFYRSGHLVCSIVLWPLKHCTSIA